MAVALDYYVSRSIRYLSADAQTQGSIVPAGFYCKVE
jgi:hypothetical protein